MIWRIFSSTMLAILTLVVIAEAYRLLTVHNDHAAIDGIIAAGMAGIFIKLRDTYPSTKLDLSIGFSLAVLIATVWVMR